MTCVQREREQRDSVSIALLLRKAAVHTAHKMRWKLSCNSYPPAKCMTKLETHLSLRLHRLTKNLKTNWVKYHSVPSQEQDLWPVATRKGQPVKNKHRCKYNSYLRWFISPCVLELFAHNMTFEMCLFPAPRWRRYWLRHLWFRGVGFNAEDTFQLKAFTCTTD